MNKNIFGLAAAIISLNTLAWQVGTVGEFSFENVGKNVYVMHGPLAIPSIENDGFINNPAFIEGDKGIIVIDPASSLYAGENLILEIEKITTKPVLAVINTHVHGDHWLGNHAFKNKYKKTSFYAHMNMIREAEYGEGERWADLYTKYTEGLTKDTKPTIPTFSIGHLDKLTIGSEKFVIHSPFPSSHSASDIMIEHVNSKTLFTGDNVFNNRFGRFDESSSILSNFEIIEYAKKLNLDVFVPGHGKTGSFDVAVAPWSEYLTVLIEESKKGYEDDLMDYEVKPFVLKRIKNMEGWDGYDGIGAHVNKVLREIEDLD